MLALIALVKRVLSCHQCICQPSCALAAPTNGFWGCAAGRRAARPPYHPRGPAPARALLVHPWLPLGRVAAHRVRLRADGQKEAIRRMKWNQRLSLGENCKFSAAAAMALAVPCCGQTNLGSVHAALMRRQLGAGAALTCGGGSRRRPQTRAAEGALHSTAGGQAVGSGHSRRRPQRHFPQNNTLTALGWRTATHPVTTPPARRKEATHRTSI